MAVPHPLDSRKQEILKAVVADYTETGIPVGSQALVAKYLVSWSSATIRNELASLVDVGYLIQPHTSAGRIPSDLGYRYYVDFLMQEEAVSQAVRRQVDPFLAGASSLEDILEAAALVLAVLTDAVSIVTGPRALSARVKHVDLVSLDPAHALLILVLEGNLIRQQTLQLSGEADQAALSELAAQLNRELLGRNAAEVDPGGDPPEGEPSHPLRAELLQHIRDYMRAVDARQETLIVHDGVRNLLRQPEFGDVGRLQQVLEVVEEERVLGQLLATLETEDGLQMVIGAENDVEQLRTCSMVLTTYRAGETRRGTIGVLGPTRMRYQLVAPRLRYVSERVGRALDRMLG